MTSKTSVAALALLMLIPMSLQAQWKPAPTSDLPHLPDGRPDLDRPSPRGADGKPDLSGVWNIRAVDSERYRLFLASDFSDIPLLPAARQLYDKRLAADGAGRPAERCLPHGLPVDMLLRDSPIRIIHTPALVVILLEQMNHFRQIPTAGRELVADAQPTWFGYSTGKWEDDEFVVDTIGFNDETWLDNRGLPHSDALRLTERFKRVTVGRMDVTFTVQDPKAFTRPWSVSVRFELLPDADLLENICENNKWVPRSPPK